MEWLCGWGVVGIVFFWCVWQEFKQTVVFPGDGNVWAVAFGDQEAVACSVLMRGGLEAGGGLTRGWSVCVKVRGSGCCRC